MFHLAFLALLMIVTGCSSDSDRNLSGEYIVRISDEFGQEMAMQEPKSLPPYPWQPKDGEASQISKEYFRCKGCPLNPPNIVTKEGKEYNRFYDCSGKDKHSLPLREGKEYIYPILIDLLNHVQKSTGKKVIITSGHSCIAHQAFMDPSPKGSSSKHLIGAEVDFYVQGLEEQPLKVIQQLLEYYKEDNKEYKTFQRFEKSSDVACAPWFNKEIFIKLYKRGEGRDFDNRHPYPYISIQVRFDREKDEKVTVTPERAHSLLRK